jgi:pimeloyl-ACP methyl ester carboxylesterase
MVHGIGPPCSVFRGVATVLADRGFRVLLYDLFGRGYSESPGALHDEHLYIAQLSLLLDHVGWRDNYAVAGYSMVRPLQQSS